MSVFRTEYTVCFDGFIICLFICYCGLPKRMPEYYGNKDFFQR